MNKVIIIGSGPAGATAAIYAARANLKPIMIQGMQPGGQLTITTDVENYPGFALPIQGPWLMSQMIDQAKHVGTEIIDDMVVNVDFSKSPFTVECISGNKYQSESIIISTGAQAKWLGIESEKHFQGFGVSGCATCDGFFFRNKSVVVVGGGNTAVEEALYLTNHAKDVTLIHRRDKLKAEKILQDRLFANKSVKVIWNSVVKEILGSQNPKSVNAVLLDTQGKESVVQTDGVFIAIGHSPNTEIFKNFIKMDDDGYIITQPNSTKTNIPGVFAAGDVQDKIFRQAVTAAGTGCMAALEALKFLEGI